MQGADPTEIKTGFYAAYGTVMFTILTLGLLGNILIIPVLLSVEHRKKNTSPLMLNMAIVDILLCASGYSISVSYNLAVNSDSTQDHARCSWLAFINCFTGIVAIATLTVMSVISYTGVTSLRTTESARISLKSMAGIIVGIWVFSFSLSIPPAFGWNSFVPFLDGISCHPNWISRNVADRAYIMMLVVCGFFLPLTVIVLSYVRTYQYIRRSTMPLSMGNEAVYRRNVETKKKMLRLIVVAIIMFFISWSPYCIVSLMENVRGEHVLSTGVSMIPELMAKTSVVYNPIVYILMNSRFRATLRRLLHLSAAQNATSVDYEFSMAVYLAVNRTLEVARVKHEVEEDKPQPNVRVESVVHA